MCAQAGSITWTALAPGVVRFTWHEGEDRGDGLLVDDGVASPGWHAVADVLVRPFGVTQLSGAEESVVQAEVALQADGLFVVNLGTSEMAAMDWSMVLSMLVNHYRTVVGAGVTRRSEHPLGHA